MKKGRIRLVVLVLAAATVAAGGAAIYFHWSELQSNSGQLVLYGNVDVREADLAFNAAGRVERMLAEEGDQIEEGQLLATLETDVYEAEVEAARARVGAQRAALDRLLAGSRPEEISQARANVRAIEADLEEARANLLRTEKLVKESYVSLQRLDDDRARVNRLKALLKAAEQELSLVVQGPRQEDIAEARARLKADEAGLTLALRRLGYTELHAKDPGVINTRIVEPGAVVLAHSPVYTVALLDPVWIRTYVSEPDLGKIHPGMTAEVFTDSAPGKPYEGWIGFISPVAEFTPKTLETPEVRTSLVYRLRVYVRNPDKGLRQGMPVTVRLKIGPDRREAEEPAPK